LTCATFVLALCARVGIRLLKAEEWPARPQEDAAAFEQLIRWLKPRDPVHAAEVEKEKGCVRFRPEEVAASATHKPPPSPFEHAERIGREIMAELASSAPL